MRISVRCNHDKNSSYFGRIKNLIKIRELKQLWFNMDYSNVKESEKLIDAYKVSDNRYKNEMKNN